MRVSSSAPSARYGAAQQRPQPGEQLLQRERLGEVVVRAGVEALDPVADRVPRGEHEDGEVVAGLAQRLGGLDPVEPRHHHVHDHDVGGGPADPGQRLGAVAGQRHVVPVELQRPPQRLPHGLVVVDDEDPWARAVGEVTDLLCQPCLSQD